MQPPHTSLQLSHRLPFPLTIHRIIAGPQAQVNKTQPLFSYSYKVKHTDGTPGSDKVVKDWESPVEGQLVKWEIRVGDVLNDASRVIVHIQEPCTHDVQLHGLCALCGKDLTQTDYTGFSDTSRAAISMVHDVGGLTVSLAEASKLETETTSRLKRSGKLSLIVDLDQTIVHATVDPTVGEWLADPKNPNFPALSGTQKFRLGQEANGETEEGCWYFVKMRPGLAKFLKDVSEIYEMHVYTMGTRAYASEVCKIIDPNGALFGGRILSRDESGSMTRKSLQRLFPCDTSMVVIIDDRADVWDGSPNLVKVIPYEFFVGIGDINAAFLPKKKELAGSATPPPAAATDPSSSDPPSSSEDKPDSEDGPTKTTTPPSTPPPLAHFADIAVVSEGLISHHLPDSTVISPSLSEAAASAAITIHDQIENRPLSKQKAAHPAHPHPHHPSTPPTAETMIDLDALDGTEKHEDEESEDEGEREAVLKDDDRELDRVFDILKTVRDDFFKHQDTADVKSIIPSMKRKVLRGANIVFSGVIALGARPEDSDHWKLATLFGAKCSKDINRHTTHVVASQNGTAKVHQARHQKIPVIRTEWLLESADRWSRLPEADYLIPDVLPTSPSTAPLPLPPILLAAPPDSDPEESDDDDDDEDSGSPTGSTAGDQVQELAELDWNDAAMEVDAFLDETDDDDDGEGGGDETDGNETDGSVASNGSSVNGGGAKRKRPRTDATGSEDEGDKGSAAAAGSPLQKRVRTSRSRKSKLSVVLDPHEEGEGDAEVVRTGARAGPVPRVAPWQGTPSPQPPDGYEPSVGSSEIDSDDDFGSLAAELEQGWGAA